MILEAWGRLVKWGRSNEAAVRSVGAVGSGAGVALVLGLVGSFVQARYVSPDDLGFLRKYSVIANYAMFFSFGLYLILRRDYPLLLAQKRYAEADAVCRTIEAWHSFVAKATGSTVLVFVVLEVLRAEWRTVGALLAQLVAVWSLVYGSYLSSLLRSTERFAPLIRGQVWGAISGVLVLPLLPIAPFVGLLLRTGVPSFVSLVVLRRAVPALPKGAVSWAGLLGMFRRGLPVYIGDYLRYMFWPTVEIWLSLHLAGDSGVGILMFSRLLAEGGNQVLSSITQVYQPRVARQFGQTASMVAAGRVVVVPTLVTLAGSVALIVSIWALVPWVIRLALPLYVEAIPVIRVYCLQLLLTALSLPLHLVLIGGGYVMHTWMALAGLSAFVGISWSLSAVGQAGLLSVVWGTLGGQAVYVLLGIAWAVRRAREERGT